MKRCLPLLAAFLALSLPSRAEEYRGHVKNLVIGPGQTFDEVHCFACSIRVAGTVKGELISICGGADIQGEVGGDVIIVGGGLRLGPTAIARDDVIVIGGPVERDPSAQVAGNVVNQWWLYLPGQRQVFLRGAAVFLALTLALALLGYAVFRPSRMERIAAAARSHPFSAVLLGLALSAGGIYCLDSLESLGEYEDVATYLILMLGFLLAWPGFAALSLWLGTFVRRGGLPAVVLGSALWTLLMIVPVFGLLAACLLYAASVGTATLGRFGFGRRQDVLPTASSSL